MPLDLIAERDLLNVAIHEAAHAIADLKTGGAGGNIEICRTGSDDPIGMRLWTGNYKGFHIQDRTAVGLAGLLAEMIQEEGGADAIDPPDLAFEFWDYIECGVIELSATDARSAGDYSPEDVERVAKILIEHWPLVVQRAQYEMIVHGQEPLP